MGRGTCECTAHATITPDPARYRGHTRTDTHHSPPHTGDTHPHTQPHGHTDIHTAIMAAVRLRLSQVAAMPLVAYQSTHKKGHHVMSKPQTIRIDDQEYVRADSIAQPEANGNLKIVILQRGWVMVGRMERTGDDCKLHNAAVVRKFGTTHGLPELAAKGPLPETILDKSTGMVEFHILTMIASIACDESKWSL